MQKVINKLGKKDLFNLIKSLTKGEKRYFKLFAGMQEGEKHYLKVFDIIEMMEEYDDDEIIEKIADKKIIKNLHAVKHYLFELILKSLRVYNSDKNSQYTLQNKLLDIDILLEKGLNDIAYLWITKALKTSSEIEEFNLIYSFLAKKDNFHIKTRFVNIDESDLEKHILQKKDSLSNISEFENNKELLDKLEFINKKGLFSVAESGEKIKQLLQSTHLQKEKYTTVRASLDYYYIKLLEAYFNNNSEDGLKHSIAFLNTLETSPSLIQHSPLRYLYSIINVISSCSILQYYKKSIEFCDKLKQNLNTYKNVINVNEYNNIVVTQLIHKAWGEIHLPITTNKSDTPSQLEKYCDANEEITSKERMINCYFALTKVYFFNGNYKKSLQFANKLIAFENSDIQADYFIAGRIIQILTHIEKENFLVAKNLIREFEKLPVLYKSQSVFISVAKIYYKLFTNKKELDDKLKIEYENVRELQKNEKEQFFYRHCYLDIWLQSKLEKKPILQLIQQLTRD
ncbi:MAG: hypothetical protein J0M08_05650 [Bacteroidetes bacterium]|nr:hypothetical protein [Bacteroidota bacterium]